MIDVDNLTIEDIFAQAAEKGLKPREWVWKRLQPYNGFNHEQRVRKWQALHLAIQLGLIPPANSFPCDICGTTSRQASTSRQTSISFHSQRYDTISEQYPLCKSCHTILHMRLRYPKAWRDLLERYETGSQWWEKLM